MNLSKSLTSETIDYGSIICLALKSKDVVLHEALRPNSTSFPKWRCSFLYFY